MVAGCAADMPHVASFAGLGRDVHAREPAGDCGHRLGQGAGRLDYGPVSQCTLYTLALSARSISLWPISTLSAHRQRGLFELLEDLGGFACRRRREHVLRFGPSRPRRSQCRTRSSSARPVDDHPAPPDWNLEVPVRRAKAPAAVRRLAADLRRGPLASLVAGGPALGGRHLHGAAVSPRIWPHLWRSRLFGGRGHPAVAGLWRASPGCRNRAALSCL